MQTTSCVGVFSASRCRRAIGKRAEDVNSRIIRSIVVRHCDKRFVQVRVATVSDNRVKVGLVAIVVATARLVIIAQATNGLCLVLLVRRVIVRVSMRVGIYVCAVGKARAYKAYIANCSTGHDKGQDAGGTGSTRFIWLFRAAAIVGSASVARPHTAACRCRAADIGR